MHIKYLAYNLIKTDFRELHLLVKRLSAEKKISKKLIYQDLIYCLFKFNTKLIDYFYLSFFEKEPEDRAKHTNVWDLHRFHKKYNGKEAIIFRDKLQFRERFKDYFTYPYFGLKSKKDINLLIDWIKSNAFEKIVAKKPLSSSGKGVVVLKIELANNKLIIDKREADDYLLSLFKSGYTLFESFVTQHKVLKQISPQSINTIRVVTFVNEKKEVEIWVSFIRFGVNNNIDNFSRGGISANVDFNSGRVNNLARARDPFHKIKYDRHPSTGEPIFGILVPFWDAILEMLDKAALEVPEVRTVGWDIALTPDGPTLIEGNDNWGIFEAISEHCVGNRIKALI